LALAQAMMLGIASIGSRCGAIPETLGPGGAIIQQQDAEGLRQALETFLISPIRRADAATAGREFALQNYTVAGVAVRYLDALERARCHHAGRDTTSETLKLESIGHGVQG
jgi:glycosyltransferase involved in cell wall biosynthesis